MKTSVSSQNIDELIIGVKLIIGNRCSLSDQDRAFLSEVVENLEKSKRQKTIKGVAQILLVVKAIELLTKFFL